MMLYGQKHRNYEFHRFHKSDCTSILVFPQACLGPQPWMVSAEASRAEKERGLCWHPRIQEKRNSIFLKKKIGQVRMKHLLKSLITQADQGKERDFPYLVKAKTGWGKKHLLCQILLSPNIDMIAVLNITKLWGQIRCHLKRTELTSKKTISRKLDQG